MSGHERETAVHDILSDFRGTEPLRQLFWTELNYDRADHALNRRGWNGEGEALADDPVLLATGGQNQAFHIIYARLASDKLPRGQERPVVSRLLAEHPFSLFVFSNAQQDRWHFLNVKYQQDQCRRRVFRRITVGPGEHLRTATERTAMLDLATISPDLFGLPPLAIQSRHDEAFDVGPVTDEFFRTYREVFEKVEKEIQGIADAGRKRLFTQRMFNRLLFLAFIEKKSWLRFRDRTDYLDALWEDYLAHLSAPDRMTAPNFYRDRLELLFFVGLNTRDDVNVIGINRGGVLKELIGDIPYLNGGLFEKEDEDDDPHVVVPDDAIRRILTELFSPFNFTVDESTPLDIEVAVDPEMLGRVFEELVTGRRESGSYYTPKPVVAFMGREALKGYLETALPGEQAEAITRFVDDRDPAGLRNAERSLEALRAVRICDPACGSGAYLLGMLHELMDLRLCLFRARNIDSRTEYDRKLEIIQRTIYGVDNDPFAANIARLRLWLSLAVDFDGPTPEPLPNLDFKIEVGDSVAGPTPLNIETQLNEALIRDLVELKSRYLRAHEGEKRALRSDIESRESSLETWAHPSGPVEGFDWAIRFAEVFLPRSQGRTTLSGAMADIINRAPGQMELTDAPQPAGFDIVLANPPYIRQERITDQKPRLKAVYGDLYGGTADLYVYFYYRAIELLRPGGMLVFISSNKWLRAGYGAKLRAHLAKATAVRGIIDFRDLPVFAATAYPLIIVAEKGGAPRPTRFTDVKSLDEPYPDVAALVGEQGFDLPDDAIEGDRWTLTDRATALRLRKMRGAGVPLGEYVGGRIYRGIVTGFNEAFVIDGAKRAELIAAEPKSEEIIKPLVIGRDIRKWHVEHEDRWIILTKIGVPIKRYPAVFDHLERWQRQLEARWDKGEHWWELRSCDYYEEFEKPKIVFPDLARSLEFAFDHAGAYASNTCYMLPVDDLCLLGVLNSAALRDYYVEISSQLRGGYIRSFTQFMELLPVPVAPRAERTAIAALVEKCLAAKGVGCEAWEREIDERVARLYGVEVPKKRE